VRRTVLDTQVLLQAALREGAPPPATGR
jgi:hypothetical protein